MANPEVGNKFAFVNLSKSYGQSHNQHQNHHHNLSHSVYQGSSRARPGGSGGMVVLSRPRSSLKAAGPKLSVPPPRNLPSLRKEHERFDSLGSGGGPASGGVSGGGQRPLSLGMGWTKPSTAVALLEKEGFVSSHQVMNDGTDLALRSVDGVSKGGAAATAAGGSMYMPPSARSGIAGPASSTFQPVEKMNVFRGEDFPSLRAALPVVSGSEKKQKDGLNQKQKQIFIEESGNNDRKDGSQLNSLAYMRPRLQSEHGGVGNGLSGNRSSCRPELRSLDEYFPEPLPLVRLNPRSDWADDERDTGHGFTYREHGFSKSEAYWETDFDLLRPTVLPHKPSHSGFDRWGQRDNEIGKVSSSKVTRIDSFDRDVRTPNREGWERNVWRASSPLQKDEFGAQGIENERNGTDARSCSLNREANKETKLVSSTFRDMHQDDSGRRDLGYGQGGRQPWNNSFNMQRSESNPRECYSVEQYNRFGGDTFQSSLASKSSFSSGGRGFPINDPVLNFGSDKRPILKSEKPYQEDPFMKEFETSNFDGRDPFSVGLVWVVKRKKDTFKQTVFHDPVRESFEAELERVQKMQEKERQRITEEQEIALELIRREEEERLRIAREQEEQQRRLEEEAREAAWRAEQNHLEAIRKAEEQRIAREEEKQKIVVEEERSKQAAKQKLLELEERIAKRQIEAAKGGSSSSSHADEKLSGMTKERGTPKVIDMGDWEDSERMVERITTSVSSDSSGPNKPFDMSSRAHCARDNSCALLDRGKRFNSWRRDAYANGNSSTFIPQDAENGHYGPRQDTTFGGRTIPRKEFYGGPGVMSSKSYSKAGILEPRMDEFTHSRGQRWNMSGDGDHYGRNSEMESDFHENLAERYGDSGWGQLQYHGNADPPYPDQLYRNPEADTFSSFGRSRYSMRHPRVPPPPNLTSMQKTSYRHENERPGPSTFHENEVEYTHMARSESTRQTSLDSGQQHNLTQLEILDVRLEITEDEEQNLEKKTALRCDSQASLSVYSPPDSPVHLSHDDLDESGDSSALSAAEDGKDVLSGQGNDHVGLPMESGNENVKAPSSSISAGDDEEWTVENHEEMHEQEEYDEDEDEDAYQDEDEVEDGDDEDIDLTQEFEDMHLDEKGLRHMINQLVLGFNEGVEVAMPNDEFERSPHNDDTTFAVHQLSTGTVVEDQGSLDGMCGTPQFEDVPSEVIIGNSSKIFQETDKAMQNLVNEPDNTPQLSAASELMMDHMNASSGSIGSSQRPIPSPPVNMAPLSTCDQTAMSTVSAGASQAETPVKLQFGLCSGPSLIPSPVQAIQIGSIQLPLLHPQVGASLTHMHPSQSSLFQFGQGRYTTPISQGVLPLATQSVPYVGPSISTSFLLNQNAGVSQPIQPIQQTSAHNLMKTDALSLSMNNHLGVAQRHLDLSEGNALNEVTLLPAIGSSETTFIGHQGRVDISCIHDSDKTMPEAMYEAEEHGHNNSISRNFKSLSTKESDGLHHNEIIFSQSSSKDKRLSGSKAHSFTSGSRGRRYVVSVRNNSGPKSSFMATESPRLDTDGFQRRHWRQRIEFQVRENADKRQTAGPVPANHVGFDNKSNINARGTGISTQSRYRRVVMSNKPSKQTNESESLSSSALSQEIDCGSKVGKVVGKESLTKSQNIPYSDEGTLKRTIHSEDDVDAPLHSGVVRVFKQPGIEAPSDEDDFIEVRSKRQMLNDRREQREKEIKAKSRVTKMPRKPQCTSQSTIVPASTNKISVSVSGEAANGVHSDFVGNDGRNLMNLEVSTGFNTAKVSPPLAPIGTPAVKSDAQADLRSEANKSLQNSSIPVVSGGGKNVASGLIFDSKNKIMDNVETSMGSWGNSPLNQEVMVLTQTQLDEAMNPGKFDSRVSVKEHTSSVGEPSIPSLSIVTKDKSLSSTASPINSLLAGEKIQFGAVTSPTVLPPSAHAVSLGIVPPGPCRSDVQISHNLSTAENDCTLFFDKEKHSNGTCVNLVVCETEAAASAIAVAAISSDEVVGSGLGTCPVSVSETKSFGGAEIDGITTAGDMQSAGQARAEESLCVALPADLSVDNPPISLWPPLASPTNTSDQMISHFPGDLTSHFPLYEMNPMLGGPIFTFGPHEESVSTQSQSQKTSTADSSPLGIWQQCHSGVDSFYGAPAVYSGPFIDPTGGIPGFQGPPHMVVYNHFAPVGQFGQVGLSFMGTTYIPSAKPPGWKRSPVSSAVGAGVGEVNNLNLNMAATQRNPTSLLAAIHQYATGSPLFPCQHHSMVLHNGSPSAYQSSASNGLAEFQTSTPSDSRRNSHAATDVTVSQSPEEPGLVHASSSTSTVACTQNVVPKSLSLGTVVDVDKTDIVQNGNSIGQDTCSGSRPQSLQQENASSQPHSNSSDCKYRRVNADKCQISLPLWE